jgi:uncharacterized protein with NAD-binding domain and iron-sulfur cluster
LTNIPDGIVTLEKSPWDLSFLDNSQVWDLPHRSDVTFLNIVASDFQVLAPYTSATFAELLQERLFSELREYIAFRYDPETKDDDIDRERCHLQTNVGEQLFTNQVGSWQYRPETTCSIPNIFVAGDYCRTFIDVTTIESAVVSGLMAAEAVRQRAGHTVPVAIVKPDTYPQVLLTALRTFGMPSAYAAKALAVLWDRAYGTYREFFPHD